MKMVRNFCILGGKVLKKREIRYHSYFGYSQFPLGYRLFESNEFILHGKRKQMLITSALSSALCCEGVPAAPAGDLHLAVSSWHSQDRVALRTQHVLVLMILDIQAKHLEEPPQDHDLLPEPAVLVGPFDNIL